MAYPVTNTIFRKFITSALTVPVTANAAASTADLNSANIKLALYVVGFAGTGLNFDTNSNYGAAPWNADEVTGGNYVAGGEAVDLGGTPPTLAPTGSSGGTTIIYGQAGVNATWTNVTFSAVGGLVYDVGGSGPNTDKWPIVSIYFATALGPQAGTCSVTWNAGIFTIA